MIKGTCAWTLLLLAPVAFCKVKPLCRDKYGLSYTHPWYNCTVQIGGLAIQGAAAFEAALFPTFRDYLTNTYNATYGLEFEAIPLNFNENFERTETNAIDFIYSNPAAYTCMMVEFSIRTVATLVNFRKGNALNKFAGVIFTQNNSAFNTVDDMRQARVEAVSISGLGAMQLQQASLLAKGLDVMKDVKRLTFAYNQNKIVADVQSGAADIGFVRTDMIDRSVAKGKTRWEYFKVLEKIDDPAFPFSRSTDFTPEWPIGAMPHVPGDVSTKVGQALMVLDRNSDDPVLADPGQAGNFETWTSPGNYFGLLNMLESIAYYSPEQQKCLRSKDLDAAIRCPAGYVKRAEANYRCSDCAAGYDCLCKPCAKLNDPELTLATTVKATTWPDIINVPQAEALQNFQTGCLIMSTCGTFAKGQQLTWEFVDRVGEANRIAIDAPLITSVEILFEPSGIWVPMTRENITVDGESLQKFTIDNSNALTVGTHVIQLRANGGTFAIPMSPVLASILEAPTLPCDKGSYLDQVNTTCVSCPQFKTTSGTGSIGEASCFCDTETFNVRQLEGQCGCNSGQYMDYMTKRCKACSRGENCEWGTDMTRSLQPPDIEEGYWATTVVDVNNFQKHNIYRCYSDKTCLGTEKWLQEFEGVTQTPDKRLCASGRYGKACSLCEGGFYGGPDYNCPKCEQTPSAARVTTVIGFIPIVIAIIAGSIAAKKLGILRVAKDAPQEPKQSEEEGDNGNKVKRTSFTEKFDPLSCTAQIRMLKRSGTQSLKTVQIMGIVSFFNVVWPSAVLDIFDAVRAITANAVGAIPLGCLAYQQTVAVTMIFRWTAPLIIFAVLFICVLASTVISYFVPQRFRKFIRMLPSEAFKLAYMANTLFFASLLQSGFLMLTCADGPNGIQTVMSFPHLECSDDDEWKLLMAFSVVYILVFGVGFMAFTMFLIWTVTALVARTDTRGNWHFAFQDYRNTHLHWPIYVLFKDFLINVIGVVFAANPTAQLILSAVILIIYAGLALREMPFVDTSSSILEVWASLSVFSVCILTTSFGFSQEAHVVAAARESDADFEEREQWLARVVVLTFVGLAAISVFQVMLMFKATTKCLPRAWRPATAEQRRQRSIYMCDAINDKEKLLAILEALDPEEFHRFDKYLSSCSPLIGLYEPMPRLASGSIALGGILRQRMASNRPKEIKRMGSKHIRRMGSTCEAADDPEALDEESAAEPAPFAQDEQGNTTVEEKVTI